MGHRGPEGQAGPPGQKVTFVLSIVSLLNQLVSAAS